VLYSRDDFNVDRAIGLGTELYNSNNDPNLETTLASTNIFSTAVDVYRCDFPSITSYSSGFVGVDSITNIVNDTYALTEVVLKWNYIWNNYYRRFKL